MLKSIISSTSTNVIDYYENEDDYEPVYDENDYTYEYSYKYVYTYTYYNKNLF
jgi:hypothetical protein